MLRFWETEFETLAPKKSKSGQRLYTADDLETILQIKQLLYQEKLTIEGARNRLSRRKPAVAVSSDADNGQRETLKTVIEDVVTMLNELKKLI